MSSRAEQKRRRKARTAALSQQPPITAADREAMREARATSAARRAKYERRDTGLEWLHRKGKISREQVRTGERYGAMYRLASIESGIALKSCLDDTKTFGAMTGGGLPAGTDYSTMITMAREQMAGALVALHFHVGMIAALDLICGKQLTPREALGPSATQREVEQVEDGLRIGLDILETHWRREKTETAASQGAPATP